MNLPPDSSLLLLKFAVVLSVDFGRHPPKSRPQLKANVNVSGGEVWEVLCQSTYAVNLLLPFVFLTEQL